MVLAAGLEVNALVHPAHGPVHLPGQLAVEVLREVEGPLVPALALIFRHRAVLVDGGDLRGVLAAVGAEDADGIVGFSLSRLGFLSTEAVQNIEDLSPFLQRGDDVLHVFAAAVHIRLIAVVHGDAELVDGSHEFLLEVIGIVRLFGIEGVRNVLVGQADVAFEFVLLIHLGYVHRDLAESVVLVPGEEKAGFLAFALQGLAHEQCRRDLT